MMLASLGGDSLVQKRYLQLIENQSKVKVAERNLPLARNIEVSNVWFVTLATVFAGAFYFWGYYFWDDWWRALTGG
jgi:hypothetical protein